MLSFIFRLCEIVVLSHAFFGTGWFIPSFLALFSVHRVSHQLLEGFPSIQKLHDTIESSHQCFKNVFTKQLYLPDITVSCCYRMMDWREDSSCDTMSIIVSITMEICLTHCCFITDIAKYCPCGRFPYIVKL
jgi:hypothetical protein